MKNYAYVNIDVTAEPEPAPFQFVVQGRGESGEGVEKVLTIENDDLLLYLSGGTTLNVSSLCGISTIEHVVIVYPSGLRQSWKPPTTPCVPASGD